jgi:hypothetical protein
MMRLGVSIKLCLFRPSLPNQSSFQIIKLNSSNLICDCNLLWFFNWMRDHSESLDQIHQNRTSLMCLGRKLASKGPT